MAKKKISNNSKQQQQQQHHEENVLQPQPPTSSDNTKIESLKNLNSLLLQETTQRRQQVQSLESHLSNTVDDNVVSELEKSVAFAFIKSRVEELGFVFDSDKHDTDHVVSEMGFEVEELKFRLSEVSGERDRLKFDGNLMKEKVKEGVIREEKVLEELRKLRLETEKLREEGFRKEKVIEEVISGRDSDVSKLRELNEKVLEELRKARVEGEKLGLGKERVIVEVRQERDSAVRESRELKEKVLEAENSNRKLLDELHKVKLEGGKLTEEGSRKDILIGQVTGERDSALSDSRELKEKLLEADDSNKRLLGELQKVRLEGVKLVEEGRRKERVIGEVTAERDSAVRDSKELKGKLIEAENSNKKLLGEVQKVRLEGERLVEEGRIKERVITVERDSAVRESRELKEKLLEADDSNKKLLGELQKVRLEGEKLLKEGHRKERVINEVTAERDLAVKDSRELKGKLLEAENSNKKLLGEFQKVRLEGDKLVEEGHRKERVISEVTMERDLAVKDSRELKGKLLEAENSNKKLLGELQKVRSEGDKLVEEGHRKERVISEVTDERDSAVRNSIELKETLLEAENSKRKLLEELQKVRLEGEKLIEEGYQKERLISEVTSERDSAVRSLQVSVTENEKLKAGMDLVTRENDEISKANDVQKTKISSLESELVHVNDALNNVCKEEKLLRGKILELEDKVGTYAKKEEGLMLQIRDLVKQKEENEGSVEKALDEVRKELEYKQREIEKVKVSYMKEIAEVQNTANKLNQSCKDFGKKNSELVSEVENYVNAVKKVTIERDNIRRGFEEEKNKAKSLMMQIAEMKGKTEAMAAEIGSMKSEKVKLLEKNEKVETLVSVLMDEKDALQQSLLEAQRECDEVRGKVEFYSLNSNQVLEMLKNAAALVSQDREGVEEVVSNEHKPEEEIRLYAEQLDAIRDAFRNKNKMVADMKQQSEVLQRSVHEAHKMKSLWTKISSGASFLAAVFAAAYVAKGH